MNQFEQCFTGFIIPPQVKTTSASATVLNSAQAKSTYINTAGYNFLIVRVALGDCAGIATALKLQECATSGGSYADITGAVYGTGSAPALPNATTGDNTVHEFYIDLANTARLQFVAPVVTIDATSTGDYVTAWYELYKGSGPLPFDDTTRGVTDHVRVGA